MPKLSTAQMKKAVEEFKKQFTGGFYHGSGSNKIKAFDSAKNTDPMKLETPGVTFVTRDPDFAESFLPGSERGGYKTGATMYPVKVKLGKHWNPSQPESQQVVEDYLAKMYPHEANPDDLVDIKKQMLKGNWIDIENPNFLQHLRDTGHDTFHIEEGGIPNVGVLKPQNIRGKFAKFNPEDAESADFMKAAGGSIVKGAKKLLEHAKSVPFVHYSNKADLSYLDPNMYGTGIKGKEAARLKDAPDIRPRSYIYTQAGGRQPEQGLGPHRYEGVAEDMYPLHEDPMGFSAIAKQSAIDPYMMQFNREVIDESKHLNELERLIKKAGYKGYANDDVGLLFQPTGVQKIQGHADGGSIYKNLVPAQLRTFGETLIGNTEPITEKNFTPEELDQVRNAIAKSRERQETDAEYLANGYNQSVGYGDYSTKNSKDSRSDFKLGSDAAMRNTLGRFSYDVSPEGNLVAKDNYDFKDDLVKEEGVRRSSEYTGMSPLEKITTLVSDTISPTGSINTLPSRIGSAFIGDKKRPIELNLGKSPFKKSKKIN